MPDVKNPNVKSIDAALEQVTYPSSVDDMLSSDTPFEGTANALPPSGTNPVFGADGALSAQKITKIKNVTGTNEA